MLQARRSLVRFPIRFHLMFLIDPILLATLGPGVDSARVRCRKIPSTRGQVTLNAWQRKRCTTLAVGKCSGFVKETQLLPSTLCPSHSVIVLPSVTVQSDLLPSCLHVVQ
jgi:hypothetical protein